MMSYTERVLRIVGRICVVMPLGLMMLLVELLFGAIAALIFAVTGDLTESALIRVRLYRNARWEVFAFFLGLRRILRGEEP